LKKPAGAETSGIENCSAPPSMENTARIPGTVIVSE
jgi:hypothetical protein